MRIIKSSLYKFVKNGGYLIHLCIPLLGVALFAMYFAVTERAEAENICFYLEVIGIMMPAMSSVVITRQYEEERKAGVFQNVLTFPGSKTMSHLSNMLMLLIWGFLAVILAVFGMGIVFQVKGYTLFHLFWYIKASVIIFITNVCWYFIAYMICYIFGGGVSLGLGVVGTIMAALMRIGLSLGDRIWQFMPSCYSSRIIMSMVMLNAKEFANEKQYLTTTIERGMPMVYIMTIVSIIVYIIWSNCWQGNKGYE